MFHNGNGQCIAHGQGQGGRVRGHNAITAGLSHRRDLQLHICLGHQGAVGFAGEPNQRDVKAAGKGQQVCQFRRFAGVGDCDNHIAFG